MCALFVGACARLLARLVVCRAVYGTIDVSLHTDDTQPPTLSCFLLAPTLLPERIGQC